MRIVGVVDEFIGLQSSHLRQHDGKSAIELNICRDADRKIRRSLGQDSGEFIFADGDDLIGEVARRQSHLVEVNRIPEVEEDSSAVFVGLEFVDHVGELVEAAGFRLVVGAEVAKLESIDRTEIAGIVIMFRLEFRITPFIPEGGAEGVQVQGVGRSREKPEEFGEDGFREEFTAGDQGEVIIEVESVAALQAGNREATRAGSVTFKYTILEDGFEGVIVGGHEVSHGNLQIFRILVICLDLVKLN